MTQLAWPAAVADVSLNETIQIQAIAWLKADARITALVGTRIYTNVPANAIFPLLLLEGFVPARRTGCAAMGSWCRSRRGRSRRRPAPTKPTGSATG